MPSAWLHLCSPRSSLSRPLFSYPFLPTSPRHRAGQVQPKYGQHVHRRVPALRSGALACFARGRYFAPRAAACPAPSTLSPSPLHLRAIAQGTYNPNTGQVSCFSCAAVRLHAQRVVALKLPAQQRDPPPSPLATPPPHAPPPSRRARTTQARVAIPAKPASSVPQASTTPTVAKQLARFPAQPTSTARWVRLFAGPSAPTRQRALPTPRSAPPTPSAASPPPSTPPRAPPAPPASPPPQAPPPATPPQRAAPRVATRPPPPPKRASPAPLAHFPRPRQPLSVHPALPAPTPLELPLPAPYVL